MTTQSNSSTLALPASGRPVAAEAGRWAALPVLLAGTFMVVLDFFIVNVALPSMQTELHAGAGAIEWVVAGFALTSAVFLITAARLGDRIGRRRTFSIGLAVFTLSSAACGVAGSPTVLVAARLAQGVGAALLMPNVLSIINVTYAGADLPRALGVYGLVMGLAAACGQLIGGGLIQADLAGLGWRTCFLINIPVGICALALAPRFVPESRADGRSRLDLMGTVLLTAGLIAVVLPLVEGRQHGWPTWTWISLAVAPVLLLGFVSHQRRLARRGGAPLLPPAMFRNRAFTAGLVTQLGFWCGQASFFLVLALYLQQGRGLSALDAGLVFTIMAVAYVAASAQAPALVLRFGRRLLAVGALVLAAGHGLLLAAVANVGVGGSILELVPGLVLIGAGMGLLLVPLTTTILSSVETHHAGGASGAVTTVQNVGGALGVAITGVIFFGALHGGYAHALELSLIELAALLLGVAVLTRLLPATPRR
ncbi:MAG TPA: MFS transporter [Solirubrobacteraceae bacterium]|nr:MFS transporter [Solirubrobacteraceae bacterium]